jgi:pSer/pThr/pTyr-binding forkhead associated (FHA) protein
MVEYSFYGKTIRVGCKNPACRNKIVQKVPKKSLFLEKGSLSTISLKNVFLKYYNENNEIVKFLMNAEDLGVGRKMNNQTSSFLQINDKSVSGLHCIISKKWSVQDQLLEVGIKDLSSTNGTMINGVELKPEVEYRIEDRDIIQLGSFQILIIIE